MQEVSNVQFTLVLPKMVRDMLRTLAAEKNIRNPDQSSTASSVGREILCDYLETLKQKRRHMENGQ
jgi:hypothetical protein